MLAECLPHRCNDFREARGTRRVYRIDPGGLGELRRWLSGFRDDALEAYQAQVDNDGEKR